MKANSNSFYSQNGNKVINFEEGYKAKNTFKFLGRLSEENNFDIIFVREKSKPNYAKIKIKKAEQLSMILVFLLLYLPDINIFEFIWESIKEIHFKRIHRISYEAQRIGHE